jgi:TolB protein
MKQFTVAISLCVAFSALVNAERRKIAYERGKNIFVADADGTHSRKIAEGALPEISPDGTRVAFNTEGDAKNRPGPERHIAIADVASGKVTVLPNIPSDNCFGPVWSPDGKQLAFSIMADKAWQLSLVNADSSGFRFVKNAQTRSVWRTGMGARWQIDFLPRSRQHLPDRSRWKCFEEMGALENLD